MIAAALEPSVETTWPLRPAVGLLPSKRCCRPPLARQGGGVTCVLRPTLAGNHPCAPSQGDGDGSGVGGLGVRAQDPFALAARTGSLGGLDEAMLAPPRCLRASVGRRTHARTARPRADVRGEPSPMGS